ncbi:MAG: FecR domain-containing protein [Deltaproteobacteria bacterium]|nr:FecR domain-containing protein [Deltaproteobacteria bacterium]
MSDSKNEDGKVTGEALAHAAETLLRYEDGRPHLEPLDDLARRRLLDGVLARAASATSGGAEDRRRARIRGAGLAVALAASLAAIVATAIVTGRTPPSPPTSPPKAALASRAVAVKAPSARVLLSSGSPTREGAPLSLGDRLAAGDTLTAADGRLALGIDPGICLLAEPGSRLRLGRLDTGAVEVLLEDGEVLASVDPGRRGPRFSVATPAGRVTVRGTVFAVSRDASGDRVEVFRGEVAVDDGAGEARAVGERSAAVLGRPGTSPVLAERARGALDLALALDILFSGGEATIPVASIPHMRLTPEAPAAGVAAAGPSRPAAVREAHVPDAASLLQAAQSRRAAQDWKGTAEAYETLIATHGASPEARVALVSLGSVLLEHLQRPQSALDRFGQYLAGSPRGSLAPEAAWGSARALARLGRSVDEERMLHRILTDYPDSLQAEKARARLEAMSVN